MTDRDIYRAANLLITRHGVEAVIAAGRKMDRLLDHDDLEGREVWQRIKRAIEVLQAPPSGMLH